MLDRAKGSAVASDDLLSGLKSIGEISAILVAMTFIAGWSYLSSYYVMFGLSPFELQLSIPATSAFAIQMLWHSRWAFPVAAIVFVALIFMYKRLGSWQKPGAAACLALLFFVAATAGSVRGRSLAREDMNERSSRLPSVGFTAKTKGLEPDCLGEGTTDCKLLLHTDGTYYFFVPISSSESSPIANRNLNVYMASDSEIQAVHIVRGIE